MWNQTSTKFCTPGSTTGSTQSSFTASFFLISRLWSFPSQFQLCLLIRKSILSFSVILHQIFPDSSAVVFFFLFHRNCYSLFLPSVPLIEKKAFNLFFCDWSLWKRYGSVKGYWTCTWGECRVVTKAPCSTNVWVFTYWHVCSRVNPS